MEAPQEQDVDFSEVFSMEKIAFNTRSLNYCRVFVAIVSGAAAGILGLEGLIGFLAFFITTFALSAGAYLVVGCEPKPYFKLSADVWTEGIKDGMMSYILFWTLFYDIVHIY
uniref:ER membrane protein complex subunit 6 n=1 Tax=Coccolithus braarudii TaxID=221442 RepID=A0A7S0Q1B5_9EUKA|mmetsp:Transcript_31651/g.68032  ORF Transcript_31651/g.68032 Transcript_31651/m.68032 type:complete len:112 (+) Transcript_31651:66-401(+)